MNKEDVIAFYTTKEVPYGVFSNFYRAPIDLEGYTWPTSEHFYQAHKTTNHDIRTKIREAATPKEAASIGRSIPREFFREDWEDVKFTIMKIAVRAKFMQHRNLGKILLETGDKVLVEWTEGTPLADSIWGNARDKNGNPGLNLLGKCLMEVRDELKPWSYFYNGNVSELDV